MADVASRLAREFALVLLRLTPAGAFITDSLAEDARQSITAALSRRDVKRVESLAHETAEYVRSMALGAERNEGAANAAAWDVLQTVEQSQITAQRLVALDLDPQRLAEWMITHHGQADAEYASPERQRNYRAGISMFSRRLVADAMEIPGIQVVILGEVLSRQRRILSSLESDMGLEGQEA